MHICLIFFLILYYILYYIGWKFLFFSLSLTLVWKTSFLVLSPHLNHFRPVEANANKFPDINKSRNRIPSFFYQILPGNDGGNPCEDDRSDTSVSDPWERCLDSGLKLGVGRESGGELLLLSTCLSHNPSNPISSYHSQHVRIRFY